MKQHVILDFDGTLVDSLPIVLGIARQVLPELQLSNQEVVQLRNMSAREVIKRSGVSRFRQLKLLIKGKQLLGQQLDKLKVFPGINHAIKELHQKGYQISVVSSNSEINIRRVLRREGIEKYFAGVYGGVGLFNKARVFKVVLRDQRATAKEAIYVGDEVRDIEAAHQAHIPVVSVTWGYNSEEILKAHKPDYLAHTAAELLNAISEGRPV